ncbi:MAG: glycosyltransferase family 2 protein [Candidatus Promineifilaceae bacterium]
MKAEPLVSTIIPVYNAANFLAEAIEGVLAQSYPAWELLLIDDGSSDASPEIAGRYAARLPEKVRALRQPRGENHGISAARNLGLRAAAGSYLAFLDADDVWLPTKLEGQVAILERQPRAGWLYGNTLYWHSWTGAPADQGRDFMPALGITSGMAHAGTAVLPLFLEGKAAVPCMGSLLVRKALAERLGGFVESFGGIYEDQVFYAKLCLAGEVAVWASCWDKYRQHPHSAVARARQSHAEAQERQKFLQWLARYLQEQGADTPELSRAVRRALWLLGRPAWLPASGSAARWLRWAKKWLLRLEESLAPEPLQALFWGRDPSDRPGVS